MRILNNDILGKNFKISNMKLSENGLFKTIKEKNKELYDIFLTDDVEIICEIMDIKFMDIDKKTTDESNEIILKSPYFNNYIFFTGYKQNKTLTEFYNYLIKNDITIDKKYKRISKTRVGEILGFDLYEIIKEKKNILLSFDKRKYSGKVIIEHFDFDLTYYSLFFDKFFNSFDSDFEFKKFVVENTEYEISKRFVNN